MRSSRCWPSRAERHPARRQHGDQRPHRDLFPQRPRRLRGGGRRRGRIPARPFRGRRRRSGARAARPGAGGSRAFHRGRAAVRRRPDRARADHARRADAGDGRGRPASSPTKRCAGAPGFFQFRRTEELSLLARDAALQINVDRMLLEGYRRVDEWRIIEREISNFDEVFVRNDDKIARYAARHVHARRARRAGTDRRPAVGARRRPQAAHGIVRRVEDVLPPAPRAPDPPPRPAHRLALTAPARRAGVLACPHGG